MKKRVKKILILNGPNLNCLGAREPEIYGRQTLGHVKKLCREKAATLGMVTDFRQSNHEGDLVDWIQEASSGFDGLILNAAAYTHTSIAIHDALKLLKIPVMEVHISDPKKREKFRYKSFVEPLAAKVFKGQGVAGYTKALEALAKHKKF